MTQQTPEQILSAHRLNAAAAENIRSEMDDLAREYAGLDADNMQESREALLTRQRSLSQRRRTAALAVARTKRALDALPEAERELLRLVYCEACTPLDVMDALAMEKSSYYRLRKKALAHFAAAYFGE